MPIQAQVPPCRILSPELRASLRKRTEPFLLNIIRTNSTTQYASQVPSLTDFRDAISMHGMAVDETLLSDFRRHVPVTDYDSYKPWIARFDEDPCQASRVENLLAPGLPFYIAVSSATSGKAPKLFPTYEHETIGSPPRQFFNFDDTRGPTALIFFYGHKGIIKVEREPGQVKRIPLCLASGGRLRITFGWDIDNDESRLSTILPNQVAPWSANMITHNRSFLMIHALFCLACPDLDQIFVTFVAFFVDLVRLVEEEWDWFITCIRDGRIPELDGIDHLQAHLQDAFNGNPERANELVEIGPPFKSGDGWAAQVWPRLRRLAGVCSGSFGMCLPQVRTILGPTIAIRNHGYGSSEALSSVFFDPNDLETFVFETEDVVEFVDADAEGAACAPRVLQGWELEAERQYQIVYTTRNGLWRYLLDDIIEIVGFDSHTGSPVFKYIGRKNAVIRLYHILLSDAELVRAIQPIRSEDVMDVRDFTTILDDRKTPQTVGYIVELSGQLGSNANMAASRLADALGAENDAYRAMIHTKETCRPTIRIVQPGMFMRYRRWWGEKIKIGVGQVKVPVVLSNVDSRDWILEKVVQEL